MANLLTVAAPDASAATVEECQLQLVALNDDTLAAAGSFSNTKDVTGLVGKVDAASMDLTAGKNADALLKLEDFEAKLTDLAAAPKPKVDPAAAAVLIAESEEAAACIGSIA
jgi:hypothetical protein